MPMVKSGFRTSAVRRAEPTSWQEEQQNNAGDLWDAQQPWLEGDRSTADANRSRQTGVTDQAYSGLAGFKPSASAGYNPSELGGFNPSDYLNYAGGAAGGASTAQGGGGRLAGYSSAALTGFDPTVKSEALKGFSAGDVSGFDPSAYGKEFAGGAYGDFKTQLGDELNTLGNASVGRGRLKTGFFDKDRGSVVTRLGADFNNKIAQEAGVFSGQRLSALESGAGMRLSAAQGIDANSIEGQRLALQRAQGIDSNMLNAAQGADQNAIEGGRLAQAGADTRAQLATKGAQLAYDRAARIDELKYGQAHDTDEMNFRTRDAAFAGAAGRERGFAADYGAAADRYGGYVSSTRDWANADREQQDQRDVYARENAAFGSRGRLLGGTPYRVPDAAAQSAAEVGGYRYKSPY